MGIPNLITDLLCLTHSMKGGMPMFMNKLSRDARAQLLGLMVEGVSIRAISRLTGASKNTIVKLLADAGEAFSDYQDRTLRGLTCKRVQVDEIWAFVYAKAKNVETAKAAPEGAVDLPALRLDVEAAQVEISTGYAALAGVSGTFRDLETEPVRLGEVLEQVEVKEKIKPDQVYRLLGVRWHGEGAFVREEKLGKSIKASTHYRASTGWIIYNRLFAFRGSFAVLGADHDGCHASNEFPTFRPKPDVADGDLLSRYIVHCLNSPQYLAVIDAESTGSTKTSRNRFNEEEFLDLIVQVPKTAADLRAAVDLLDKVSDLKRRQQSLLEMTKSFREEVFRMLPEPAST